MQNTFITQRLNVFLAHQGVCSRRDAMDLIQRGRVSVNGKVVKEPSMQVAGGRDRVTVDDEPVEKKSYDYIMLNKPAGYMTTREDKFADKMVLELLPPKYQHLNPVGRLDKDTEGLLILTNDGELAHQLTHPKFNVDKTYLVKIQKQLTDDNVRKLQNGVILDGVKTAPARIEAVRLIKPGCEFLLTIHEGRKRQVRMMLGKVGHYVTFLKRVRQGPLTLGHLPTGKFRILEKKEVEKLKGHKVTKTPGHKDMRNV